MNLKAKIESVLYAEGLGGRSVYWNVTHPMDAAKQVKRSVDYFIQRGRRGFSDRDLWSMDLYFARVLAEAVGEFRKNTHGYPAYFESSVPGEGEQEWDAILLRIQEGFQFYVANSDGFDSLVADSESEKRFKEAWDLMGEHYASLWD